LNRRIREALQIDSRTLKRWRQWWLDNFVHSSFWKAARARFMPPVCELLSRCRARYGKGRELQLCRSPVGGLEDELQTSLYRVKLQWPGRRDY
jgi:hypothetical protein